MLTGDDIAKLRIGLASPQEIRSWSRGEVTESETINYRTHKAERGGLFAEEIFGPENDYECSCGKYRGRKFEGIVCEKCNVLVTSSDVRRANMGHIELASPVVHFWYLKGISSPLSTLLGLKRTVLKKIAYYETEARREKAYLVTASQAADIPVAEILYQTQVDILGEKKKITVEQIFQVEGELEVRAKAAGKVSLEKLKLGNGQELVMINVGDTAHPVSPQAAEQLNVSSGQKVEAGDLLAKSPVALDEVITATQLNFLKNEYPDLKSVAIDENVDSLIFLVTSVKTDAVPLKVGDRLNELEKWAFEKIYPGQFEAETGAKGIQGVLANMDLNGLTQEFKHQVETERSDGKKKRILKRLEIVEQLARSSNRSQDMILEVIPVLPPELRPIVQLEGGKFATTDLNDLYRRIINRNNRLKKLNEMGAPEVILRNERRMLQEAVDALIHNEKKDNPILGRDNRPLKSLSERIQGKHGRMRRNLLGKRVDYSGRAVIVVNPKLKLHQCGLPKKMALELFKPFLLQRLGVNVISNYDEVKNKALSGEMPEVWDELERLIKEHPVLLNRAPTLHRLGIQGFEPILVDGEAIQIHPFVCPPYNADFDGDQMAVHLPLSQEAIQETREIMLAPHNILKPSDGGPVSLPHQDAIFAFYYLTIEDPDGEGQGKAFGSLKEAERAHEAGVISLHAPVKIRLDGKIIDTTLGRAMFNVRLPEDLRDFNKKIDSDATRSLIMECFHRHGNERTVQLLDDVKELGFIYATKSGLTISVRDCLIPQDKKMLVDEAFDRVKKINTSFERGMSTEDERKLKVIDVWMSTVDRVADVTMKNLSKHKFNPVYMIVDSGARGSSTQIKQLAGMRGPMSDPSGRIIEMPVISNFREGLNVMEYFISTHGGRKGTADTALKTADSGYLTRRLVDATEELIIKEEDCHTRNGIEIDPLYYSKGEEMESVEERIYGRVAADTVTFDGQVVVERGQLIDRHLAKQLGALRLEIDVEDRHFYERVVGTKAVKDIKDPKSKHTLVTQDELVTRSLAEKVRQAKVAKIAVRPNIIVRSAMTCAAIRRGLCQKCYGIDMTTHQLVRLGVAVGVIAAQSIGEPGTQLTMKTFHTGGVAGIDITQGLPRAEELFEARKAVRSSQGEIANVGGVVEAIEFGESGRATVKIRGDEKRIRVPTSLCQVNRKGEYLMAKEIISTKVPVSGQLKLIDDGLQRKLYVLNAKDGDRVYALPEGIEPRVKTGQWIKEGTALADEFHEEAAVAKVSGKVIEVVENDERYVVIEDETGNLHRHRLPHGARRTVETGAKVIEGEKISTRSTPIALKAETAGMTILSDRQIILYVPHEGQKDFTITEDLLLLKSDGDLIEEDEELFALNIPLDELVEIDHVKTLEDGLMEVGLHYKGEEELTNPAAVKVGDKVKEGDLLSKGVISPHLLLKVAGVQKTRDYLITEIHKVYKSQGVDINDKHLELVICQMLNNVRIKDARDSSFLPNELISLQDFQHEQDRLRKENTQIRQNRTELLGYTLAEEVKDRTGTQIAKKGEEVTPQLIREALQAHIAEFVVKRGKEEVTMRIREKRLPDAERVLLRISKAALEAKSWISAASFQRTTTVLGEAALKGSIDPLEGLKPCVITSKRIRAGRSFFAPSESAPQASANGDQPTTVTAEQTVTATKN
ncbi:DNA-directed RNA polymerase subunit beta' [Candidatus Acetothermia bacterium]|nr:DNA-directed RNA polymerase subunit beta' [Candidatus Acetothermia bacterium]